MWVLTRHCLPGPPPNFWELLVKIWGSLTGSSPESDSEPCQLEWHTQRGLSKCCPQGAQATGTLNHSLGAPSWLSAWWSHQWAEAGLVPSSSRAALLRAQWPQKGRHIVLLGPHQLWSESPSRLFIAAAVLGLWEMRQDFRVSLVWWPLWPALWLSRHPRLGHLPVPPSSW